MKCDFIDKDTRKKIGECTIVPTLDNDVCILWVGCNHIKLSKRYFNCEL